MPNLDYDPKNPTDLMGRTIADGDIVAWGTTWGRSPAVCVAEIDKILFKRKAIGCGPWGGDKWEECAQQDAEKYQLRLRPIKTTGDMSYESGHWRGPASDQDRPKTKTIHLVQNVVKLVPLDG